MKKFLVLLCCLCVMGYLLYDTGFFSYIQSGHSLVEQPRIEVKLNEYSRSSFGTLQPLRNGVVLKPDGKAYDGSPYLQQFVPFRWQGAGEEKVHFWSTSLERAVDKIVAVSNAGNIPVYVRVIFAFEQLDCKLWKNVYTANGANEMVHHGSITIHGDLFDLYSYTYSQSLAPGSLSSPCLLQIVLDAGATSADLRRIAEGFEISSVAQACQASGLPAAIAENADASQVLNALLGEISTEQHPWVGQ